MQETFQQADSGRITISRRGHTTIGVNTVAYFPYFGLTRNLGLKDEVTKRNDLFIQYIFFFNFWIIGYAASSRPLNSKTRIKATEMENNIEWIMLRKQNGNRV